ncbi:MAG: hypothetical protein ABIH00_10105 [Armatimonadota bacterium]
MKFKYHIFYTSFIYLVFFYLFFSLLFLLFPQINPVTKNVIIAVLSLLPVVLIFLFSEKLIYRVLRLKNIDSGYLNFNFDKKHDISFAIAEIDIPVIFTIGFKKPVVVISDILLKAFDKKDISFLFEAQLYNINSGSFKTTTLISFIPVLLYSIYYKIFKKTVLFLNPYSNAFTVLNLLNILAYMFFIPFKFFIFNSQYYSDRDIPRKRREYIYLKQIYLYYKAVRHNIDNEFYLSCLTAFIITDNRYLNKIIDLSVFLTGRFDILSLPENEALDILKKTVAFEKEEKKVSSYAGMLLQPLISERIYDESSNKRRNLFTLLLILFFAAIAVLIILKVIYMGIPLALTGIFLLCMNTYKLIKVKVYENTEAVNNEGRIYLKIDFRNYILRSKIKAFLKENDFKIVSISGWVKWKYAPVFEADKVLFKNRIIYRNTGLLATSVLYILLVLTGLLIEIYKYLNI